MLICLGGFVGSGSRGIAEKISERFGYFHYDIGQHKFRTHQIQNGVVKSQTEQPKTDAARVFIYERALAQFPLIAKMHENVVVPGGFVRTAPREYFLSNAAKYFNPVVFVWVTSDEESASARFKRMYRAGGLESISEAKSRRANAIKNFQGFSVRPLTYHNATSSETAASDVMTLITESVGKR